MVAYIFHDLFEDPGRPWVLVPIVDQPEEGLRQLVDQNRALFDSPDRDDHCGNQVETNHENQGPHVAGGPFQVHLKHNIKCMRKDSESTNIILLDVL